MSEMFYGVANLKTIYVWENFKTDNVTNSNDMFKWAINIEWWNRTIYDENKLDKEYAVIDDETHSWYFTSILDIPYTITYNLEWWELSGARTIYTERTNAYVIPYPKKEWYTFEWWTWSNGEEPQINVSLVW
jgi:surface protein